MEEKFEEPVEEKVEGNKKGKGSIVTIVVLIIVVLGLACYICYDKGLIFKSKETTSSNTKEELNTNNYEEKVTFTDSELQKYVDYITPAGLSQAKLLYDTASVDAKSLTAGEKIQYIGSLVFDKQKSSSDYEYSIISEADVKNAVEEVYGKNSYEKATFNLGCGDYTLNENDKNYYSKTGCGGTTATFIANVVTSYNATKSKLEITTSYAIYDGIENKIYKDYNKTSAVDSYAGGDSTEDTNSYLASYAKNNKEKLNTIVYTFESTDGVNYYFTGFKNNK